MPCYLRRHPGTVLPFDDFVWLWAIGPEFPPAKEGCSLRHKLVSLVQELVENNVDLQFAKRELEAAYIHAVLESHQGNIGHSARALGMHRNTLTKRLKELQIPTPKDHSASERS